jgi:hypothetical protein
MIKLVVDENDEAQQELVQWVNTKSKGKEYLINLISKQSDPLFCDAQNIQHYPVVYAHDANRQYRGMDFVKQYLRGYFKEGMTSK